MTHQNLFIGIDLGGTKISTALMDAAGEIITQDYRKTRAAEGQEAVIQRMVDAAHQVMSEATIVPSQVTAAGVCSPGPIDARTGVLTAPPNLPGVRQGPLPTVPHRQHRQRAPCARPARRDRTLRPRFARSAARSGPDPGGGPAGPAPVPAGSARRSPDTRRRHAPPAASTRRS